MKTKLFKVSLASALLIILAAYFLSGCTFDLKDAGGMATGNAKEFSQSADLQGKYDEVKAELDMFSAKASVGKSDNKLVEGNFKYSSEELKPEFKVKGNNIQIKNDNIPGNLVKPINHWNVKLTDKAPLDLGITSAASEGRFDLSGMAVKKIDLEANASSIRVFMDTPNSCELKRFNLSANAGSYELDSLGNFNFNRVDIDSKASRLMVGLDGEYRGDGAVRIKADASTLKLRMPDNVGVRIIIEQSNISTVLLENKGIVKNTAGGYESKDYDKFDTKLTIYLDLNVTTINII